MAIWSAEIKELEKLNEFLKGQLPDLEKELERLVKADDENMILLYSRRCLEVIITDLCECELKRPRKTEPLKGIIDKLHKEGKVSSNIITSMHGLNELSTYGTHPKDFDLEQVKPVLNNLDIIIKWYLKYKETGSDIKAKPVEEIRQDIKTTIDAKKDITISRKRLAGILGGSMAIIASVFAVLYFSNIIGYGKQTKEVEKSIAVLPFHNYSGDPAQEFMCEGLTDEIIGHLFKIKSLDKVIPLDNVLAYKGTNKKLSSIAKKLKVNYILTGTYKKIGDQVRVTTGLIEPKKAKYLWQNEYNQPYKEVVAIQADIALQIADHLKVFLSGFEKQNIKKIPTINQEAQELIWQATYMFRTRTYKDINQLYELDRKAIELDSDYADAYGWIGALTLMRGSYAGDCEILSVVGGAEFYFNKALELDQNNYVSHLGQAMLNEWVKQDFITAEKELLIAFELSPNNPVVIEFMVEFLCKRNRLEDARSYLKNAETPLYVQTRMQVISGALSGNKDEAINFVNFFLNSQGDFIHSYAGEYLLWLDEYEAAKQSLETALLTRDRYILVPRFQACLALAYHKTNNHQKAQEIINQLIDKSKKTSVGDPEYFIGMYYSGISKVDSAFYWLEEANKKKSPELPWLKVDPVFNNLKNDARYWDLYERTGHKAYDEYRAGLKE